MYDQIDMLNKLTGDPKENDVLIFAMPMCAPFSMMKNHKYKVKLQPGKMKGGQAQKHILSLFLHGNDNTPDKILIR